MKIKNLTSVVFLAFMLGVTLPVQAQTIPVTIPDANGAVGQTINLTLDADFGANVISAFNALKLTYDPAIMQITGASTTGLTNGWALQGNYTTAAQGFVTVSAAGSDKTGSGAFLELTVDLVGLGSSTLDITSGVFEDENGNPFPPDANTGTVSTNTAPNAVDDSATTNANTPVSINVLANDTDVDGDPISLTSVSDPPNGTTVIDDNGTPADPTDDTVTYTPDAGFSGQDTFTYDISDGNGGTDQGAVTVTVVPANRPPNAVDDTATTNEDTGATVDVLANDSDLDGDLVELTSVSNPVNGTATIDTNGTPGRTDDRIQYTPNPNFNGTDTFTYTISDGLETDDANVTMTVNPVNDVPVAVDDAATTDENTPVNIDVMGNDFDVDGDPISLTGAGNATFGTVTIDDNGTQGDPTDDTITYTPNQGYDGPDTFVYDISDGNGGTASGSVNLQVQDVVEPLAANDDAATTDEDTPVNIDVLANDDPTGGQQTLTVVTDPASGTASIQDNNTPQDPSDDSVLYTPDPNFFGTDTFSYTIADGGQTDDATVGVTVRPVNDAPVADDDGVTTPEDTPVVIDVLDGDTDAENDPLQISITVNPADGTATVNDNGTPADPTDDEIFYTPNANYHGQDNFTYQIDDGNGGTDQGGVTITIDPVNDAPGAVDDAATTDHNTPVTIDVLVNDVDVDGDPISLSSVSDPPDGTAVIDDNGTPADQTDDRVTYTPDTGYSGGDNFTYEISDGNGGTDIGGVTVTVAAARQPFAENDTATVDEDNTGQDIDVLSNDLSNGGGTLEITAITTPPNGTAIVQDNGTPAETGDDFITYAPVPNFNGIDTFEYTISNGQGIDNASVAVTVRPVNDMPVAVDDVTTTESNTPVSIDVLLNDTDIDGDQLTLVTVSDPPNGTAVIQPDGTQKTLANDLIVYTPDAGFDGQDSFTYQIGDGNGGSAVGNVVVTVNPGAELHGIKWNDVNGNGSQDANESVLGGWTINLDTNGDGQPDRTAVTDPSGVYSFLNVTPGDFSLTETLQTGWEQTYPAGGAHTGTLSAGEVIRDLDFGNRRLLPRIEGIKWDDYNGDGKKNVNEPGIEAWEIYLDTNGDGTPEWTTLTDAMGNYVFAGLPEGSVTVTEEMRTVWVQTFPETGSHAVTLDPTTVATDINFGNRMKRGTIRGAKWHDHNGNGTRDTGDEGLAGWTLYLDLDQSGDHSTNEPSAVTGPDGTYEFSDIRAETYHLREVGRNGWQLTYPADSFYEVTLLPGGLLENLDFGNRLLLAEIHGKKWNDLNGDGNQDTNEPGIEGWIIHLDTNGDGIPEQTDATNFAGMYEFMDLTPGVFQVTEAPRMGWYQTYPAGGVYNLTLSEGERAENKDFGNHLALAEIQGMKWNDVDSDGIRQIYEPGLPGWTINLDIDRDGVSDRTTLTDANGLYVFSGLQAGTYWVTEEIKEDWEQIYPPSGLHEVVVLAGQVVEDIDFGNEETSLQVPAAPGETGLLNAMGTCNNADRRCEITFPGAGKNQSTIIPLTGPLPKITNTIIISGQGGVILDGSQAGAGIDGLLISSENSIVRGITLTHFSGHGIVLESDGNVIEDTEIVQNGGDGIHVLSGTGNAIRRNRIYHNGGLGIDLGGNGVNANDPFDLDGGVNEGQNYPELSFAVIGSTKIFGRLESAPNELYELDFFADSECDDSQYGEGERYLGSALVQTTGIGTALIDVTIDETIEVGTFISATATNRNGSTSEFGQCIAVEVVHIAQVSISPDTIELRPGDTHQFTAKAFDQYNQVFPFVPVWEATGGTIDNNGLYTAGNDAGTYTVTVRDTNSGLSAEAIVTIVSVVSVDEEFHQPREFVLGQNYPNPFNPVTSIRYAVAERSQVRIEVFNLLGRCVDVLVDQIVTAGEYDVLFDAGDLPSGVYIYRMFAGSFVSSKKLILYK